MPYGMVRYPMKPGVVRCGAVIDNPDHSVEHCRFEAEIYKSIPGYVFTIEHGASARHGREGHYFYSTQKG